jgi:UDP-glucose 4-epimerase
MKNILITGASGFIGSFLVEESLKRGYRTFAGIRSSSSKGYLNHPDLHLFEMDFSDQKKLQNQIKKNAEIFGPFDVVVHSAGLTKSRVLEEYYQVNLHNTERLVDVLIELGMVPERFVFISSLASYGPGQGRIPVAETNIQAPITAYGKSKLAAEQMLATKNQFPFVIVHPTTVYGPREKDLLVLIQSLNKHLELYIGNTEQQLSFIHVQDVCKAVFLSINQPIIAQNILLSDTDNYTAKEFNNMVKSVLGKKTLPIVVPVPIAKAAAQVSEWVGNLRGVTPVLNKERLKEFQASNWGVDATVLKQLGFTPDYPLQKGLEHTIDWYKKNGWIKA